MGWLMDHSGQLISSERQERMVGIIVTILALVISGIIIYPRSKTTQEPQSLMPIPVNDPARQYLK